MAGGAEASRERREAQGIRPHNQQIKPHLLNNEPGVYHAKRAHSSNSHYLELLLDNVGARLQCYAHPSPSSSESAILAARAHLRSHVPSRPVCVRQQRGGCIALDPAGADPSVPTEVSASGGGGKDVSFFRIGLEMSKFGKKKRDAPTSLP